MGSRNYMFTIFEEWKSDKFDKDVKYAIWQKEICPKTLKVHTQGYIELNKVMRYEALKDKYFTDDTHFEKRMGTREQARAYCMKEESAIPDTCFEYGDFGKSQGFRSDLEKVAEDIKKKGLEEAIDIQPGVYIKFSNGMEKLNNHYRRGKKRDITIRRGDWEEGMFCIQTQFDDKKDWFQGYAGEKTIWCPDSTSMHYCNKGKPFWTGKRWAEWTEIVHTGV